MHAVLMADKVNFITHTDYFVKCLKAANRL